MAAKCLQMTRAFKQTLNLQLDLENQEKSRDKQNKHLVSTGKQQPLAE